MNSLPSQDSCGFIEDNPTTKMNDMSPVTNLALNLKTTSLTGTPSRRISWSNPFPSVSDQRKFLENLSPSIDSPTFQEMTSRLKNKLKLRKASQKVLPSDSEDEKENIAPYENKTTSCGSLNKKSDCDSPYEFDSQDSGYCDMSVKRFGITSLDLTPRIRVKSSLFPDELEDGFENLFQMEEEEEDFKDLTTIPDMASLLTKPLYSSKKNKYPPESFGKNGKLPIRRCLSIDMDCSLGSSPIKFEVISQTGTLLAAPNEENVNLELPRNNPFKRPEPPGACFSMQSKRRKSSPSVNFSRDLTENSNFTFQRSFSETAATIMQAVQQADLKPDLIGDCTRCYSLPLIKGRHQDLKCISALTLAQVLNGEFNHEIDSYTLVDCRYPYEFEGGHIQGALNIYTKEEILKTFLESSSESASTKNIVIFHCEFSSERAPSLCRFLRNKDREMNEDSYPKLHHPELYLLDGGYKAFFQDYKEYCEPQSYKPMNHKDHGFELKHFRAKSKSWGTDSKSRYKFKTSSISEVL